MPALISFMVNGTPRPAGSKTPIRLGAKLGVRDSSGPAGARWRADVALAGADAMRALGLVDGEGGDLELIEGPLELRVEFIRRRPKSHYTGTGKLSATGRRMPYPTTRPDTTKLLRSVEDALTGVLWGDDSQIVEQLARKTWGDSEGARIAVFPMPKDEDADPTPDYGEALNG